MTTEGRRTTCLEVVPYTAPDFIAFAPAEPHIIWPVGLSYIIHLARANGWPVTHRNLMQALPLPPDLTQCKDEIVRDTKMRDFQVRLRTTIKQLVVEAIVHRMPDAYILGIIQYMNDLGEHVDVPQACICDGRWDVVVALCRSGSPSYGWLLSTVERCLTAAANADRWDIAVHLRDLLRQRMPVQVTRPLPHAAQE